jgi:hypothetical protein
MSEFVFDQELADFIKAGINEIVWLEDKEFIDEREFDDVIWCLKCHFEGSKWAQGFEGEAYDDWFDDFYDELLHNYFERVF